MNPYTFPGRSLTESDVINTVAKVHHVLPEAITSKSRIREVVDARNQTIVILRNFLCYSTTKAGLTVMRDHSTATTNTQRFYDLVKIEKPYREKFIESCKLLCINDEEVDKVINA